MTAYAFLIISMLFSLLVTCECHFSMGYIHDSIKSPIVNAGIEMSSAPDAAHVADLYARLSGMPPLLSSGNFDMNWLYEGKCSVAAHLYASS